MFIMQKWRETDQSSVKKSPENSIPHTPLALNILQF